MVAGLWGRYSNIILHAVFWSPLVGKLKRNNSLAILSKRHSCSLISATDRAVAEIQSDWNSKILFRVPRKVKYIGVQVWWRAVCLSVSLCTNDLAELSYLLEWNLHNSCEHGGNTSEINVLQDMSEGETVTCVSFLKESTVTGFDPFDVLENCLRLLLQEGIPSVPLKQTNFAHWLGMP